MPRDFTVKSIRSLLNDLSAKTGYNLSHYGLSKMSVEIGNVRGKYLYYNLFKPSEQADNDAATIRLSSELIDNVAKYLGYNNFDEFWRDKNNPANPILSSLMGAYYLYLRKNENDLSILRSPAKIHQEGNEVFFHIRGQERFFYGKMELVDGCLFSLVKSDDKRIHHVYRIGKRKKAKLIQGIFSGVTSGFEPIGGRCLLIRQEVDYEHLTNFAWKHERGGIDVSEFNIIKDYFVHYADNNLRTNSSMSFDYGDLRLPYSY